MPSPFVSRYFATVESRAARREELDVRVGDLQQRLFDAVAFDRLAVLDLTPERGAVVVDRGFEIAYGDGNVVDLGQQHQVTRTAGRA